MCNVVSGNLLNTGAFEVSYNGMPVWSKINHGRFPNLHELRANLNDAGLVSQYSHEVSAEGGARGRRRERRAQTGA
jgi:predicted Rdx family selenoprotein